MQVMACAPRCASYGQRVAFRVDPPLGRSPNRQLARKKARRIPATCRAAQKPANSTDLRKPPLPPRVTAGSHLHSPLVRPRACPSYVIPVDGVVSSSHQPPGAHLPGPISASTFTATAIFAPSAAAAAAAAVATTLILAAPTHSAYAAATPADDGNEGITRRALGVCAAAVTRPGA